jgi:hypothetical protein
MFAKFSSLGGITRGEQGLVVAYNLRWLTHIIGHRQALGLEPVRVNFAPTHHDPLAQAPGKFTFHSDADHRIWECLGTQETGAPTFDLPPDVPPAFPETCRTGIRVMGPTRFVLQPMMAIGKKDLGPPPRLRPGTYRLRLTFLVSAPRTLTAEIASPDNAPAKIELPQSANGNPLPTEIAVPIAIGATGRAELTITPAGDPLQLCAAILEPQ